MRTAAIAAVLSWATPVSAHWNTPSEVIHGTAFTLEEGEFVFGLMSPIAYGASDTITFITHPVMWLLLTPNASIRWRINDMDKLSVALNIDATQTLSLEDESTAILDPRPQGQYNLGFSASLAIGRRFIITGGTGYQRDVAPDNNKWAFSGGTTILFSPVHMLLLQGGATATLDTLEVADTHFMLMYAHAWESVRASVGLAYGQFPIVLGEGTEAVEVPIWPVLDIWWRF
ncbi:MAG TPA: hypothetical protein EYN66_23205 [Myxococcales bacterium]|nr:hypothetical protein [Myxococcales bacterium]